MAAHGRGGRMAPSAYRGRGPTKPGRVLGRMSASAAAANRAGVESGQQFVIRFGDNNEDEEEEEEDANIPAAGTRAMQHGTAVNHGKASATASHTNAAASKSSGYAVNGLNSRSVPSPAQRNAALSRLSPPLAASHRSPTPGTAVNASAVAANGAAISSASNGLLDQISKMRNQIAAMEKAARAAATAQTDAMASGSATPPGNAAGVTPPGTSLAATDKRVAKSVRRTEAGSDKAAAQQQAVSGEALKHDASHASRWNHAALPSEGRTPPSAADGEKSSPPHSTACPPLHIEAADAEPSLGADQSLHATHCDVSALFGHQGFEGFPADGPAASPQLAPDPPLYHHLSFGSALQSAGQPAGLEPSLLSADAMRVPESIAKASDLQHGFSGAGGSFQRHAGGGAAMEGSHQVEPGRVMARASTGVPGLIFDPRAGASGVPLHSGFAGMLSFPSSPEFGMPGTVQAERAALLRDEAEVERALEERQRERRMWEDRERAARRALREAEERRAAAEAECQALENMRQSVSLRIGSLPRAQPHWTVALPAGAPGGRSSLNGPEPVLLLREASNAVPAPGNAREDALAAALQDETRLLGGQVDQPAGCTDPSPWTGSPGPMQEPADVDMPFAPTHQRGSSQIAADGDSEGLPHREGLSKKRKHPDVGPGAQLEAQAQGAGLGSQSLLVPRQEESVPSARDPAGSGGEAARISEVSAMLLNDGSSGAEMDCRVQDRADAAGPASNEAGPLAPLSLLTPVKAPEQLEAWQGQEGRTQHRGLPGLTVGGSPGARPELNSEGDADARQKADSIRQRLVSQLAAKRQPKQLMREPQASAEASTQATASSLKPGHATGAPSLGTDPAAALPSAIADVQIERGEQVGPAKVTIKQDDEHENGLLDLGPIVPSGAASGENQSPLRQRGRGAQLADSKRDVAKANGPSHSVLGDRAALQAGAHSVGPRNPPPPGAALQESQKNGNIEALRSRVFSSLKRPKLSDAEQPPAPLQGTAARVRLARAEATQTAGRTPQAVPSPKTAAKHEGVSAGERKGSDSDGQAHGSAAAKAEKKLSAFIGVGRYPGVGDPAGSLVIPLYNSPFQGSSIVLGPDLNGTKADSADSVGIAHRAYESPLKCLQLYQQLSGARTMDPGPAPPDGQTVPPDGLESGSVRMQANVSLCPFELRGKCKDPRCPFQHFVRRAVAGDVDQKSRKDDGRLADGQCLSPSEFLARLQKRAGLAEPRRNFPPASYSG